MAEKENKLAKLVKCACTICRTSFEAVYRKEA